MTVFARGGFFLLADLHADGGPGQLQPYARCFRRIGAVFGLLATTGFASCKNGVSLTITR